MKVQGLLLEPPGDIWISIRGPRMLEVEAFEIWLEGRVRDLSEMPLVGQGEVKRHESVKNAIKNSFNG